MNRDETVRQENWKKRPDKNEFVNVEAHTVEELKQMIFEGKIEDSKTVAAILAYDAKYNR